MPDPGSFGSPEPAHEVVHECPPDGSGLMPCCGRTPFEVPRYHRMTVDLKLVTCGRPCVQCAEIRTDWPGFSAAGLRRLHVQHGHDEAGKPSQQPLGNNGGVS